MSVPANFSSLVDTFTIESMNDQCSPAMHQGKVLWLDGRTHKFKMNGFDLYTVVNALALDKIVSDENFDVKELFAIYEYGYEDFTGLERPTADILLSKLFQAQSGAFIQIFPWSFES